MWDGDIERDDSMTELIYEELHPHSRDEISMMLISKDVNTRIKGILVASLFDPDSKWATDVCINALKNDDLDVKIAALTGLSHIVRIHGTLELLAVTDLLRKMKTISELKGPISDLMDDIDIFLQNRD